MRNRHRNHRLVVVIRGLVLTMVSLGIMGSGCEERDVQDGLAVTNEVAIPVTIPPGAPLLNLDVKLDLACADAGINDETCILDDPANPFVNVSIPEFDANNPDAPTKYDLANQLPQGPAGAKTRFYFWATALARRASGENQYQTAVMLHEMYELNRDPLIQMQALRAYRSVLDNFFNSVIFFVCGPNPDGTGCRPPRVDAPFSNNLNIIVAKIIFTNVAPSNPNYYPNGYAPLVAGDALTKLALFSEWGYTYNEAMETITINGG
ncbi:MAG: hypothetical protein HKN70_11780 [Gammaproteobacteria bacterium]|nr:hypothetical protein [Gammaproteobacteria bacterium]